LWLATRPLWGLGWLLANAQQVQGWFLWRLHGVCEGATSRLDTAAGRVAAVLPEDMPRLNRHQRRAMAAQRRQQAQVRR
jgi:hypothetical protein